MGIPTINFDPSVVQSLKPGIYVCRVIFPQSNNYWGVLHFGPRPVFGEEEKTLEAWLFDFDKDKNIPQNLDLELYDFIRPVKNFANTDDMLKEINNDVAVAKAKINTLKNQTGA